MSEPVLQIISGSRTANVKTGDGVSIAIEQTFGDSQPNHFETPDASRRDYEGGGFVGNTNRGGSCNVDVIEVIPHCNGTHTETMGHIVRGDYFVSRCLLNGPIFTLVISVTPIESTRSRERYDPPTGPEDRLITADAIEAILSSADLPNAFARPRALVIRTLPNDESKLHRQYTFASPPPFLTNNAMEAIRREGFEHLLLDLPSVDRMQDRGRLSNHCIFWDVDVETRKPANTTSWQRTITEMCFIPDSVRDGLYLLDLQVSAFNTDASPSRPVLFPIEILKS
jgi:hypothetical protein